jgi:hypothetical protein
MTFSKRMKCPHCGSKRTSRILYGMPSNKLSARLYFKLNRIVLGGCVICDDAPSHYCNTCEEGFGLYSGDR